MPRIAFIGAGSVEFTRKLLADVLSFPELAGSEIALHDIDPERLETAEAVARRGGPLSAARRARRLRSRAPAPRARGHVPPARLLPDRVQRALGRVPALVHARRRG